MVEGYEKAFAACADKEAFKARRHRIEHCTLVDQDLIDRMAKMNICPSVNAGLQIRNGKNLARFYGPERNKYLGALKEHDGGRNQVFSALRRSLRPCGL